MKKAFSLIELIVVLGIISIILSVAVVKTSGLFAGREKDEIKDFVSDLNYGKKTAMAKRTRVSLVLADDGRSYELFQGDPLSGENLKTVDLERIEIKRTSGSRDPIFLPKGAVVGACSFEIKGDKIHCVTIQPVTGKVNLYEEKEGL